LFSHMMQALYCFLGRVWWEIWKTSSPQPQLIQGQSTLTEQIRKSYSTNDLRVPDDSSDQMDSSISYIDDDDDELGNYCYYCK
jgi:hypothetical protein